MAATTRQALQPGEVLLFSEAINHSYYGDHVTEVRELCAI